MAGVYFSILELVDKSSLGKEYRDLFVKLVQDPDIGIRIELLNHFRQSLAFENEGLRSTCFGMLTEVAASGSWRNRVCGIEFVSAIVSVGGAAYLGIK